jgi:hypothetical protein|tara:strand:- start:708 stop:1148 length:441 start_codon:yes stop_codon:yes gene_type:complete
MPLVTLTFNHNINESVQVGDIAYYVSTVPVGVPGTSMVQVIPNAVWTYGPLHESTTTPHFTETRENVVMIGPIVTVTLTSITCDMPTNLAGQYGPPTTSDFIMFSKDNKANVSSLLGYYSLLKLRNNSKTKAEMFSVAADFIESSK